MMTRQEPVLSPNAIRTLHARYLWKNDFGKVVETPAELMDRVSRTVAMAERQYLADPVEIDRLADQFYDVMARGLFLPNSPTLMNAGRSLGVLSACFVLPIGDSIDEIFESVKHTAQIQRAGGGTGFSFDRLRPTGDTIASSGGRTSGPISFWRVFSEATRAIQQGAFRRGANMGMMSIEHPDILKFAAAKSDVREFENFNISIKIPDQFMLDLRTHGDQPHVVINPRTHRRYILPRNLNIARYSLLDLPAADTLPGQMSLYTRRDVWNLIVIGAHATGEPGLCFIDRVNASNPTPNIARIEATNPCGEQPLLDYEACNLGSIDLAKFVRSGHLDESALRETIRLAVRFLDDVIDVNNYIIPEIAEICRGNRKIGLGVMGLADAMFELGIKYDCQAGLDFGSRVAKLFTEEAFAASEQLARQRGSFPNWQGSIWDCRQRPMRNAAVTTVAPTGTLSILAGCSGGIEPVFALAFYRHILDGQELLEVNGPFERYAKAHGFWSRELALGLAGGRPLGDFRDVDEAARELFVTAHDIAPEYHLRMQAAFQQYVDGAISKTINLPQSASVADVDRVYQLAFDLGLKGVTVYRDRCRQGQPMTTQQAQAGICPQCHGLINDQDGCSRCPTCGAALCSL